MRSTTRTVAATAAAILTSAALAVPANAATKSYTLAQVKQHKTSANCWSVINGNVYNLTKWIKRHPGGSSVIQGLCGINGSAAFKAGPHFRTGSLDPNVAQVLSGFKVGKLKK